MSRDRLFFEERANVGKNLEALRIKKEESISRVARAVSMKGDRLSKIEKGKQDRLNIGECFRLCEYFQVDPTTIHYPNLYQTDK